MPAGIVRVLAGIEQMRIDTMFCRSLVRRGVNFRLASTQVALADEKTPTRKSTQARYQRTSYKLSPVRHVFRPRGCGIACEMRHGLAWPPRRLVVLFCRNCMHPHRINRLVFIDIPALNS